LEEKDIPLVKLYSSHVYWV